MRGGGRLTGLQEGRETRAGGAASRGPGRREAGVAVAVGMAVAGAGPGPGCATAGVDFSPESGTPPGCWRPGGWDGLRPELHLPHSPFPCSAGRAGGNLPHGGEQARGQEAAQQPPLPSPRSAGNGPFLFCHQLKIKAEDVFPENQGNGSEPCCTQRIF